MVADGLTRLQTLHREIVNDLPAAPINVAYEYRKAPKGDLPRVQHQESQVLVGITPAK